MKMLCSTFWFLASSPGLFFFLGILYPFVYDLIVSMFFVNSL